MQESGLSNPRFEAQLLLAHFLNTSRASIIANSDEVLTHREADAFLKLTRERARGRPMAYLRGYREFYGLNFLVTPDVLIPRPETELLVEFAIKRLGGCASNGVLIDVGAGCGCIIISALAQLRAVRGIGIDLSPGAIRVARANNAMHGGRASLVRASLLQVVRRGSADLIVSNPPYIPTAEIPMLDREIKEHEPHVALDGGPDGLRMIRGLITQAREALKPGGWLAFEVGMGQAPTSRDLMLQAGYSDIHTLVDLSGAERVVAGRRPAKGSTS